MKWPLVTRKTANQMRVEQRRRLIDHLRANNRGLVLLDNAVLTMPQDLSLNGITVLGDHVLITSGPISSSQPINVESSENTVIKNNRWISYDGEEL